MKRGIVQDGIGLAGQKADVWYADMPLARDGGFNRVT